jgi:hypothetical protein
MASAKLRWASREVVSVDDPSETGGGHHGLPPVFVLDHHHWCGRSREVVSSTN